MKKELTPIIISSSGERTWLGGAYVLAFVYSKKGNFLVKGYMNEVKEYIKKTYTHYFVNYSLWHNGEHRNFWSFWKNNVGIFEPARKKIKIFSL